jgi:3-oxoadipate enol-lactonase
LSAPALARRRTGSGPDVVLVNGGMMTYAAWEPIASRLDDRFRVLRFDLRGQLLSPGEPPSDLRGHVSDIVALLDELALERAHVVGVSFGAMTAVELAAEHPDRVRSLLLLTAMDRVTETFRRDSDTMRAILADVLAGGDRGPFYDRLLEGVYSERFRRREAAVLAARKAQITELPLPWFAAVDRLLASIETFDLTPHLAAVRCPTEVVIAGDDRVMERERALALAAALHATVVEHPTAGHGLVIEEPEWVANVILDFLSRQEVHSR